MNRHRAVLIALGFFAAGVVAGAWFLRPAPQAVRAESTAEQPPARRTLPPDDGKLRIICFGAHPDDCELQAGGVAALWAAQGHHVKFVSVTNGDIGHWRDAGGPLASRDAPQKPHAPIRSSASPPKCSTSTTASCCRPWRIAAR
jgi:hypothetical protein